MRKELNGILSMRVIVSLLFIDVVVVVLFFGGIILLVNIMVIVKKVLWMDVDKIFEIVNIVKFGVSVFIRLERIKIVINLSSIGFFGSLMEMMVIIGLVK